eukprot:CAMPEP_0176101932 /NCGR_PEP_ID=MMETSP0120_2-20121206/51127_1 /TAXON_ID=160619 /ORGANISM="Kryptoperidinium foliaceum, Strain CCMP 1326" /LENGTH=160 /DNA_ID=CAMNT_0017435987 /DNA_START=538 /DNA_END=1017 /DNA_ORIENTATION=+
MSSPPVSSLASSSASSSMLSLQPNVVNRTFRPLNSAARLANVHFDAGQERATPLNSTGSPGKKRSVGSAGGSTFDCLARRPAPRSPTSHAPPTSPFSAKGATLPLAVLPTPPPARLAHPDMATATPAHAEINIASRDNNPLSGRQRLSPSSAERRGTTWS